MRLLGICSVRRNSLQSGTIQQKIRGNEYVVEELDTNLVRLSVLRFSSLANSMDLLLIPCSVALAIFPSKISPLNGRNTIKRNLTVSMLGHEK